MEKYTPTIKDSEYVIWRTVLDKDVRASHMRMEGRVYHRDHAIKTKDEIRCRCEFYDIPNNWIIIDSNDNIISSYSWIKYGGASAFAALSK